MSLAGITLGRLRSRRAGLRFAQHNDYYTRTFDGVNNLFSRRA